MILREFLEAALVPSIDDEQVPEESKVDEHIYEACPCGPLLSLPDGAISEEVAGAIAPCRSLPSQELTVELLKFLDCSRSDHSINAKSRVHDCIWMILEPKLVAFSNDCPCDIAIIIC